MMSLKVIMHGASKKANIDFLTLAFDGCWCAGWDWKWLYLISSQPHSKLVLDAGA
jgi:hypothetical protein